MAMYSGIDLHSNNSMVVVIDDRDRRLVEKRIPNDLALCLELLEPFREELDAVAVESTFNWYWLVDGLTDHGYQVRLVNTAKVRQYEGLKVTDDRHDAFWLAHLMRLGILPTGYVYPRPLRWVRDLLRKRLALVRERTRHLLSLESRWARHRGEVLSVKALRERLKLRRPRHEPARGWRPQPGLARVLVVSEWTCSRHRAIFWGRRGGQGRHRSDTPLRSP